MAVKRNVPDTCSICARPIAICRHPWDKPFQYWPTNLAAELTALLPVERHPGS